MKNLVVNEKANVCWLGNEIPMGPSLYYVSTFLDIFTPTHSPYVSINSTERQQKSQIFLNPPTQSLC